VVFDGLAVHRSDMNTSEISRHAYAIHIYDGTSEWSKLNWLVNVDVDTAIEGNASLNSGNDIRVKFKASNLCSGSES